MREHIGLLTHNQTRHGYCGTPIYGVWASMVKRCENSNHKSYKYYGGRGISVCEEWRMNPGKFIAWALANGYRVGLQLDRMDNDGNYEPSNCQFITPKENCAAGKRRLSSRNKSGERNIVLTRYGTYEAWITVNRKQKYVGVYKTIAEAVEARNKAEAAAHDNPELLKGGERERT